MPERGNQSRPPGVTRSSIFFPPALAAPTPLSSDPSRLCRPQTSASAGPLTGLPPQALAGGPESSPRGLSHQPASRPPHPAHTGRSRPPTLGTGPTGVESWVNPLLVRSLLRPTVGLPSVRRPDSGLQLEGGTLRSTDALEPWSYLDDAWSQRDRQFTRHSPDPGSSMVEVGRSHEPVKTRVRPRRPHRPWRV